MRSIWKEYMGEEEESKRKGGEGERCVTGERGGREAEEEGMTGQLGAT